MIPKGKYIAQPLGGALGLSDKGNEYVSVIFRIQEGDCAGEERDWRGYFTEATAQRTIESLRYCGWQGADLQDLAGVGDKQVQIVIDHEEGKDGKVYDRVRWVNRLRGPTVGKPLEGDGLRSFAARMKGLCVTVPVEATAGPQSAPAPHTTQGPSNGDPGVQDEDLGF